MERTLLVVHLLRGLHRRRLAASAVHGTASGGGLPGVRLSSNERMLRAVDKRACRLFSVLGTCSPP